MNQNEGVWRLEIGAGPSGSYRLAQLDDYQGLKRRRFPWHPPLSLELQARSSAKKSPGTWGFGLWNDPFGFSLGFGGGHFLPALPNAAWFFFASAQNHLALNANVPSNGAMAASISSPSHPAWLPLLGLPALPMLLVRPISRAIRRLAGSQVRQHGVALDIDPRRWQDYGIEWNADSVHFKINGESVLDSTNVPRPPLALVLWLDNQYAAWRPDGSFAYGTLATSEKAWIEIRNLRIQSPKS